MTEESLIERIVQELDKRTKPTVPIEHALWSSVEIGAYLHRPAKVVRDRVVCIPGFPKAIRLPNADGSGRGLPNPYPSVSPSNFA